VPGELADLAGHRIYVNPWADDEHADQPHAPAAPDAAAAFLPPVDPPRS
jgi:hypothetical protein